MSAFYSEHDPYAAQWIRNLISAGHVAPGIVDERDIRDISPDELAGFTQCHFFAGIGVWSHALRRAGWPDDKPIWTGSCPCQPFSAAGRRGGTSDERHLWPHWFWLIDQCRPPVVTGEQVASKDGLAWLDTVSADMEGAGYAFGASDLCAAGFSGAHIRQRLYFVGVAEPNSRQCIGLSDGKGRQRNGATTGWQQGDSGAQPGCSVSRLDHHHHEGPQGYAGDGGEAVGRQGPERPVAAAGVSGGVADANSVGTERRCGDAPEAPGLPQAQRQPEHDANVSQRGCADHGGRRDLRGDGLSGRDDRPHAPMLGRYAADWLFCRDGKWRPVGPGSFPLAHEAPARVGRLRAYGNALDAETATEFCAAVREIVP